MEGGVGGGGGGFGHRNLQNNPHIYRPTPPLTAIDRFLWGQSHFKHQHIQDSERNKEKLVSTNGLCSFSSSSGAIGAVSLPSFQETSFVDGLFADGDSLNWTHERNPNEVLKDEVKVPGKNFRGTGKKGKKGSSSALIKGQWTEEEDR